MIVVAGENLVDLVADGSGASGAAGALSPRLGGGPFTVARTLGRLGADVAYLGTISDDRFGRAARAALDADGVDLRLAATAAEPTTLALAELDATGGASYRFYTEGTAAPRIGPAQVHAALAGAPAAVHVGTLGLLLEPGASAIEDLVDALPPECLVVLDPNVRPALLTPAVVPAYRARLARLAARADVVKVSDEDLAWLGADWLGEHALSHTGPTAHGLVLLTRGGAAVDVLGNATQVAVPVTPVRVVDTIGAGDSFGGGFLAAWLAQGLPPAALHELGPRGAVLDAVRYGIAVSGITCGRAGADPPTAAEVLAAGFVLPVPH